MELQQQPLLTPCAACLFSLDAMPRSGSPHNRDSHATKLTPGIVLSPNTGPIEQLLRDSLNEPEIAPVKRPWAIKGIDEFTIQLCKLAARGRGMKINRWVADALSQAAQCQFGQLPEPTQGRGMDLQTLYDRISRLEGEVASTIQITCGDSFCSCRKVDVLILWFRRPP